MDFKKYYNIPATPEEVYLALTIPLSIQLWTGQNAEMIAEPNTEFSLFDGAIVGKNISFEENKSIVQEWYFGEQENPSIVTIKLHEKGKDTSVEVRQTNIPEEDYNDIIEGWNEEYMGNLIEFFQGE